MTPMFAVVRHTICGDRQYQPGEKITDLDIESWELAPDKITRLIGDKVARGDIEPLDEAPAQPKSAPKAPEPEPAPAPVEDHPHEANEASA